MRRRELLGVLGVSALTLRRAAAADAALHFTALDHVEFLVSDAEKSAAFYARVFGNTVLKNNKTTRRDRLRLLLNGINLHFQNITTMTIGGVVHQQKEGPGHGSGPPPASRHQPTTG